MSVLLVYVPQIARGLYCIQLQRGFMSVESCSDCWHVKVMNIGLSHMWRGWGCSYTEQTGRSLVFLFKLYRCKLGQKRYMENVYTNLMFCWPCIIVHQYSETNVMHFLFNLLRIKGLYMFRALLTYPQEALHKRHLVYCVCVMSVGCTWIGLELRACLAPPEDEQVMLETCRVP
jgi:hypothetical protein